MEKIVLHIHIDHDRSGTYQYLPFTMPPGVESVKVAYRYKRHAEARDGAFTGVRQVNCVDLGLIAPDGTLAGASGSDKPEFVISETYATPGYGRRALTPGEWRILVGVCGVAEEGAEVTYEIEFTPKRRRLLKGDLHTHTLASDGVLTANELAAHARANGLDFLAVTDHNHVSSPASLPELQGMTLIPGVEWTHHRGHANFLGVDRPYDAPYSAGTMDEVRSLFQSGRERGAFISVNHPFEEGCEYRMDLDDVPFDCLEVWNGPMRESNLKAVHLWHSLLASGRRVPVCGGSDYHRDTPFIFVGGPTTCVHAMSPGVTDILQALREGHSYIVYAPDGPALTLASGAVLPGDAVPLGDARELEVAVDGLIRGDTVLAVTQDGTAPLVEAPCAGRLNAAYRAQKPGFVRFEVHRRFLPGLPALPALLSNAVYVE